MNLILCGMMGAGKTTIAKLLAEKLNIKAIDISENQILAANEIANERNIKNIEFPAISSMI